jgi:hypothetical protein
MYLATIRASVPPRAEAIGEWIRRMMGTKDRMLATTERIQDYNARIEDAETRLRQIVYDEQLREATEGHPQPRSRAAGLAESDSRRAEIRTLRDAQRGESETQRQIGGEARAKPPRGCGDYSRERPARRCASAHQCYTSTSREAPTPTP